MLKTEVFVWLTVNCLIENDKIVENDKNNASILNEFFSNIIKTLGILQSNKTKLVSHNIGDPLMKAIMKYRFLLCYLLKHKRRLLTSRAKLNLPLGTNIQIQMFGLTS